MKIIDFCKHKIKKLAAKIAGQPPVPPAPNFANIEAFKNGKKIYEIQSTSSDITDGICKIIELFHKFNDYKIVYDYPERGIQIYFTVKKAQDVEQVDDDKNSKKEVK